MIVRSWHGAVPVEHGSAFREHLLHTGIAEAQAIPGNLGAKMHSAVQGEYEHFFMVSYWKDLQSIRAFAGNDYAVAVIYPGDDQFGLISDPVVLHHEVTEVPSGFPSRLSVVDSQVPDAVHN